MTLTLSPAEEMIVDKALKMLVALYTLDAEELPELHILREDLEETIGRAKALRTRMAERDDFEEPSVEEDAESVQTRKAFEQIKWQYAPAEFEPSDDVVQAAESLLDAAHESFSSSEENFTHCTMCDEVDGHAKTCPVPALQAWMKARV